MVDIVVIFKTHIWNHDIAEYILHLKSQLVDTDFYIIMHDQGHQISDNVPPELLDHLLVITEEGVRIYDRGFINMWLSNHWILMWFWKHYRQDYRYVWSMEYDVRISGNTGKLWRLDSDADFLYTIGNMTSDSNKYRYHYDGDMLSDTDKYYGHLQLARYSNKALDYLDNLYQSGENGQDELITYSLLRKSGLSMKNSLVNFIGGVWTWHSDYSNYNKKLYRQHVRYKPDVVKIFHPVK